MEKICDNFTTANIIDDEIFPIGGWVEPLPPSYFGSDKLISYESYKKIKDCGIDFVCEIYVSFPDDEPECVLKHIDSAEKAGVRLFISDKDVQKYDISDESKYIEKVSENYKKYGNKKGFLGWLVKDEPGRIQFKDIETRLKYLKKIDKTKHTYINLLPTYSTGFMLENGYWSNTAPVVKCDIEKYKKYVSQFLEIVKPEFLSYDFYPFDNGESGKSIMPDYFVQLSVALRNSYDSQVPYIPIVQCCKFNKWSRNPTESELLWQVTTSLVYGAKGIQYFTVWTPINSEFEHFNGCIIEEDGSLKERYDQVRKINKYIRSVGRILARLSWKGIITSGESPVEIPECDIADRNDWDIETEGNVIGGLFESVNHEKYVYVVLNSIKESGTISVISKNNVKLEIVGGEECEIVKNNKLTKKLRAGEGILLRLIKE